VGVAPTGSGNLPALTASPNPDLRVRDSSVWSWVLVGAVVVYVLLSGHPLSLLRGIPLDALGLGVLLGLGCVLFGLGLPRFRTFTKPLALLMVVLVAIKLALWWSAPAYGFAASYVAQGRFTGPVERSTEFRSTLFTRIEASPGQGGPALHFFNDVERFNFYEPPDPDRRALPFAVRWDGYLEVPYDGEYPVALTARGVAALSLAGAPVLTVGSRTSEARDAATLSLAGGTHPIRVDLINQGGADANIRVEMDLGQGLRPLGSPSVTVEPLSDRARFHGWLGSIAATVLDGLVLAGIVLAVVFALFTRWRTARQTGWPIASVERPLLAAWLLVVLAYALITTAPLEGRAVVLEGGQDWLTYESYARDILLNGPLMTLGKPLGEGRPYFFQPFYPYYLAAMHWLAGEGLWGPIVLQLFGDAVAGVLLYFLAKRLFDTPAAVFTLALFAILALSQLDWVARKLLSENLYFVLLPASVLLLLKAVDERRLRDVVLAGIFLGLASITRGPTLLYVPWVAIVVAHAWWRAERSTSRAMLAFVVLGVVTASIVALVPIRNYIVSGRPALVASNGGATLLLAHQPTERVRLSGIDRDPVYNALRLDRQTREVVEFARQDPIGYLWTLVPLGLYSIGISGTVDGFPPLAPDILAISALYLGALLALPATRQLRAVPIRLFVGLHLAIMMTFLPYVYGYRQVLPMQLLMLVFCGAFIAQVVGRLVERRRTPTSSQPVMEQRSA